jgi:outer membrane biosynthesis protein TonB
MSLRAGTIRTRISLASGTGRGRSPFGLIGALALHAALAFALMVTVVHRLDIAQESPPIVPVDVVTIADKTNIRAAAPAFRPPTIKPEEPVPHFDPQQLTNPEPAAPQVEAPPAPPSPPTPTPAPAREAIAAPSPSVAPHLRPPSPPQPQKSAFNLDSIFKQLQKIAPSQPARAKADERAHRGVGLQDAMTMDLVDALRNQIEQCWSPPAGAPHAEQLAVDVELSLNPDGSVARTPQLTAQSRADVAANPFMRAAADSALRAIYVCAPYKMPQDRYADWQDSVVHFDPRDLAGQ